MKKAHLISRLTTLGLALVLLAITGFTIWAAVITRQATEQVRISAHLSDLYEQAHYAVGAEESLERLYFLEPGPLAGTKFRAAGAALVQSLQTIQRDGAASDRALAQKVLAEQERYRLSSSRMLAAIDAHNSALAHTIDDEQDDPVFSQIAEQVSMAANVHHQQAFQRLAELDKTQDRVFITTPIVFAIGLLLLGVFWGLLRSYQRNSDKATQSELARLARAALIDNLTDLGNHRAYQEDLQRALERARQSGETVTLAYIDVDELKVINDQQGHLHGDRVLTELAALLRGVRISDRGYRLSGDEFAMVLPHTTLADVDVVMENLRQDAQQKLFGATVSIGIATTTSGECDVDTLQEQADAALHEAKRRGRNTAATFEDIRESALIISSAQSQAVRRLLAERKLTVAFQPIWDLDRGVVLSFEALSRPAADYGLAGPQEAFDIAEKIGRAHELDLVCLQAILARAAELPPNALLFVNLSPQTLDHDLLQGFALVEAVEAAGLTPERVVLEITERSITRLDVVVREAKRLRSLGFRLALDDTGAGNAGLEMLSQLPVDFVKIDRAVVVNALTDKTARGVLAGIVAIASGTDTYVIAEGIENVAMLDLVRGIGLHGVQGVQGYLLGRPSETIPDARSLEEFNPFAHAI